MRLRWSTDAVEDLVRNIKYIQEDNPAAARQAALAVKNSLARLLSFPSMGKPGDKAGTRELVVTPYVVVYRIKGESIELLHIYHGARDWKSYMS